MNKILKNGTIFVLTIMLPFTVLTACNDGKGGDGTTPGGNPPTQQTTPTPTPGPTTPVTPPVVEQVPVEQITEFIKLLDSNYTYAIQNGSSSFTKGLIDENTVQVFASMYDTRGAYTVVEGDKTYSYTYDPEDAMWHKREAESLDFDSLIVDKLVAAEWTAYNKETGVFTGTFDGKTVSAQIVKKGDATEIVIADGEGFKFEVYDIDTTMITMPDASKIVDHTTPSVEPPVVEPPIVEPPVVDTTNIYTVDAQGKYDFNIVLMRDVFDAWLKGENQWGKDVVAQRTLTSAAETENVVYVNPSEDGIEFGVQYSNNGKSYFRNFTITDAVLTSGFESQTIKTEEEFVEYLNSIAIGRLTIGDMSATIDTTISDEHMATITENIFDRLATVGVQSEGITATGSPISDFADVEIIKGFKSVASSASAGAGLGNNTSSTYYYLVEIDGKVEFVEVAVAATEHQDLNHYVLNNTEGKWLIAKCERTSLEEDNKDLWVEDEVATLSARTTDADRVKNSKLKDYII